MKMNFLLSIAIVSAMTAGCIRHDVVYTQAAPPTVVYQDNEPEPIFEVVPKPPKAGAVWVPGIWVHEQQHWAWHRGHWR